MKRIIGIFISLCISVSCLGASVFAADEDKILLEEHFDFAADALRLQHFADYQPCHS